MDADVGVGLEVGHVVVGAGGRSGVRQSRGRLARRRSHASDAPRPAGPRQMAVAVLAAGEHRGKGVLRPWPVPLSRVGVRGRTTAPEFRFLTWALSCSDDLTGPLPCLDSRVG